jgi:hypothetical protein
MILANPMNFHAHFSCEMVHFSGKEDYYHLKELFAIFHICPLLAP